MRSEPGSAAILRAAVSHQILPGVDARGGDALAVVEQGPLPGGTRVFVPGRIPCGECAACRRALCDACAAPRPLVIGDDGRVVIPDRFITTVDGDLPSLRAMAAGLYADIIGAAGRAGLGAGDTAIWIGEPAWTRAGVSWSQSRGARPFVLVASAPPSPPTAAGSSALALSAGPAAWRATIGDAEAAGGPTGGRPERRIFVCGAGADLARVALELVTPGSTLSFLRGAPPVLDGLDAAPPLRLFTGGAGHPDLIPEALAAVSRGEVETDGLFVEVTAAERDTALADFRRGLDRPIPVVAYVVAT
jgi:threonine dehydrogenase-like Zn-dependent dehydrogenase